MKFKKFTIYALSCVFALTAVLTGCGETTPEVPELPDVPAPSEPVVELTDTKLAENGSTDYQIVVPADASATVLYAAEELNEYFKMSTGAEMHVVADTGMSLNESDKVISLGDTTIASSLPVTKEEVNQDGYKIVRLGDTMLIKGYVDRGVLYGVYEFLHLGFGYECYAADETVIDVKTVAYLPDLNLTDAPDFEGRFIDGPLDYNQELQAKFRIKDTSLNNENFGGGASQEWMGMHCESFRRIVGVDEYKEYMHENYPSTAESDYRYEWFSNSSQKESGAQWCLTNEVLLGVAIERIKEIIASHPEGIYVNIAEEDMAAMCNCTRTDESYCEYSCSASRAKYGISGTLIRFLNKIIDEVEPWREENYPDRDLKYVTFAYHESIAAPVKDTQVDGKWVPIDETVVPHEKLYIRFAPITRCYYHNLLDENCSKNKRFGSNYLKWCDITDRLTTWEYRTCYSYFYQFFDNFGTMQDETIRYKEDGVVNMMLQYVTGSTLASMSDLNVYLTSKILWDVHADQNKLIDDFMNAYYKTGAPYVKEYLNVMRSHLAAVNADSINAETGEYSFHMGMYVVDTPKYPTADTWDKATLEKALDCLNNASATYDSDEYDDETRDMLKTRVLRESICLRYTILRNYESYYNVYSDDYVKAVDQWEADCKTLNATSHCEGGSVGSFIAELRTKGK